MAKVDFNKNLVEMDGSPMYKRNQYGAIITDEKKEKVVRNIKDTCVSFLGNVTEEGEDVKKKVEKFLLAQRIQKSKGQIDLTADEIVMVKEVIGKYESPVVVGQVFEILGELKK